MSASHNFEIESETNKNPINESKAPPKLGNETLKRMTFPTSRRSASIGGVLFFWVASHAWAQSQEDASETWRRNSLTGAWGGLRSDWAARGINVEAIYIGEIFANVDGGKDRGRDYLDVFDVRLLLDMNKLAGWSGGSVLVSGVYNGGGSISDYVGDTQGVSNIEAPSGFKVYEAWIQQNLRSNRWSVLAGLYDINSEFDVMQSAGLFLNSSHGIGADYAASGFAGPPIYPFPALSVRLKTLFSSSFYAQAVIADGVPGDPNDDTDNAVIIRDEEGALLAGEIGWYWLARARSTAKTKGESSRARRRHIGREVSADYELKLAFGAWRYTSDFEQLRSASARSAEDNGMYVLMDWKAYREPHDDAQGLSAFLRLGSADNHASRFSFYGGAGVAYTGLIAGRNEDEIGFAVAVARTSDYTRATSPTPLDNTETVFELTYRMQLKPWLALQPNVQYVKNPGADPTLAHALVVGARLEADL